MAAVLQPNVIDVANWQDDALYFNYPEGARSKNALFPPDGLGLNFIKKSRRYLYKRSVRRYPDQFWGEVVAYQVSGLLGVEVPPTYGAFDSDRGDCGALIEWFYEDGKAEFVPGGNYMQLMMPDYDRKKGLQHNFQYIEALSRSFENYGLADDGWPLYWGEVFLFDALIGNTDRHQDNWGYLRPRSGRNTKVRLSPLFDHGTSLGHEHFVDILEKWDEASYTRYINRGTHHMKWAKGDPKKCGHVEMLRRMIQTHPSVRPLLHAKIAGFSIPELAEKLQFLATFQMSVPLSQGRIALYCKLLSMRQIAILSVLS